ncbi:amidohydrolase family protein [Pedobacter steynii]|nr:amidohydrolase family protein [Pedobacter steynii]NQX39537.1 amidohydrolase family protein [Pedobacter steynii]
MNKLKMILVLCVLSLSIFAQKRQQAGPKKTVKTILKNGTVINGTLQSPATLADVYLEDGLITAVLPKGQPLKTGYEAATIMDLNGKFILPGLIDTHVHLATMTEGPIEELNKKTHHDLERVLMGGITTVRDMGGDGRLMATYQRSANLDQIPSPDIFYVAFLAGPNYMKMVGDREILGLENQSIGWRQTVHEQDNAHDIIAMAKGSGATGIKIYSDISGAMVKKLATEATLQKMQVWSHATVMPAIPSEAVAAGVKVISHAHDVPWEQVGKNGKMVNDHNGYSALKMDFPQLAPLMALMKKNNAILDATIYLSSLNKGYDVNAFYITKKMHEAGVKVSIGTDWMIPDGTALPNIHEEMALMVSKCGFSTQEVIHAATMIGAEATGLSDRGQITEGKRADILILNSNPLENISATKDIFGVIKNGKVYPKP